MAEESKLIEEGTMNISLENYKTQRELLMRKEVVMKMLDYQIPQNFNGDDVAILTELQEEKGEYLTRAGIQLKILILKQQVNSYKRYVTNRGIRNGINRDLNVRSNEESNLQNRHNEELEAPKREAAALKRKKDKEALELFHSEKLEQLKKETEIRHAKMNKMGIKYSGSLKKKKKKKKY